MRLIKVINDRHGNDSARISCESTTRVSQYIRASTTTNLLFRNYQTPGDVLQNYN